MLTRFTGPSRNLARILLLGTAIPVTVYSLAARAQQISQDPALDKAHANGGLEEVTVTAARRTQNLQTVAQAVSVVSGAKISQQGLNNISQVLSDVPSVQITGQPQGFSIDIRGQGGDGLPEGAVALEFDGVYTVNALATTLGFFDTDRIEVLPGPQSTRYGPNADGGVVNVISKDPIIGSKAGSANLTVGNYNLVRTEVAQNIPVSDSLAIRIAGETINRSSYFTPATSNNVGQAVRVKLLYKPNDALTVKLGYEVDHVGGTGIGYGISGGPPAIFGEVAAYEGDSINKYKNPWAHGDYSTNSVTDNDSQAHLYQNNVTANVSYVIAPWVALDELASFGDIVGAVYDCADDFGPGTIPDPHSCSNTHPDGPYHQYSSETRLHNTAGSKIKWDLGFYHDNYVFASYGPHGSLAGTQGFTRLSTNAVFGEVTYPVTDRLRVVGGLRESFDDRTVNFGFNNNLATPNFKASFSHFDYRAGVEYDVAPQSLAYATVSSGYRPGGLGSYIGTPGDYSAQTYPDEVTTAFEVGTKNRFFDNRLQLNADVFYYHQTGFQDTDRYQGLTFVLNGQTVACEPSQGPGTVNQNLYVQCQVPTLSLKAHEVGLEGQALFSLTDNDQIGDTFTVLKAQFGNHQTSCATLGLGTIPAGVCADGYNAPNALNTSPPTYFNLNGLTEPHSPTFVNNFTYQHRFHFGQNVLSAGGGAFFTTSFHNSPVQIPFSYQPDYVMASANATFTPAKGNWTVTAFANNLANYAVKIATFPATTIGDPRTYGVTLHYTW